MDSLKEYGVVHGIKKNVLERLFIEQAFDKRVLVAEGTPHQDGVEGAFKLLVDISGVGKPKEREDGSVDHKELKKVINVKKGQPLIRYIPPEPGTPGKSVLGKDIDPPRPKEEQLIPTPGTEISKEDPRLLVAATDGAVFLNTYGNIEVRTTKVINGDIDYSTGNISFSGDLKVTGGVRAGFSVKADGDLFIGGYVEDTEISCSGDMEIIGGVVGSGNGKLVCGGTLKVHHIENFNVQARKSIVVGDSVLHSKVRTEETLKAKTIVGGEIDAVRGIEVETIGNASEARTIIKMGNVFFLLQQKKIIDGKKDELLSEAADIKEEIYTVVKNGMDGNGKISPEDTAVFDEKKEEVHLIHRQISKLDKRLEELDVKLREQANPVIKARMIFPNTFVRFGLVQKIIKQKIINKIICADEAQIIIRSE